MVMATAFTLRGIIKLLLNDSRAIRPALGYMILRATWKLVMPTDNHATNWSFSTTEVENLIVTEM